MTCIRIRTEIPSNKTSRRIIAMANPIPVALFWFLRDNFTAMIDTKRMLSIPKTISKKSEYQQCRQNFRGKERFHDLFDFLDGTPLLVVGFTH